jgi:hypothetical protein
MISHHFLKIALVLTVVGALGFTNNISDDYNVLKVEISSKKYSLKTKYFSTKNHLEKKSIFEESRKVITRSITNQIIPFWMGTKWSFDGHTEIPQEGNVACGYFVSTTLNHAGFKVNRFKLAQKSPEEEAKTIQPNVKIDFLQDVTIDQLKNHFIKNKKDGLYFIGLDFHVGYILKENDQIIFIHSNYIGAAGVTKEEISSSKAIISKKYYIADITYNDELVKKWLLGEEIKTGV